MVTSHRGGWLTWQVRQVEFVLQGPVPGVVGANLTHRAGPPARRRPCPPPTSAPRREWSGRAVGPRTAPGGLHQRSAGRAATPGPPRGAPASHRLQRRTRAAVGTRQAGICGEPLPGDVSGLPVAASPVMQGSRHVREPLISIAERRPSTRQPTGPPPRDRSTARCAVSAGVARRSV